MDALKAGMSVVSSDGHVIGTVKATEPGRFRVDVHWRPDFWVKDAAVESVEGDRVLLNHTKNQLVEMEEGLHRPTMTGNLND